MLTFTEFNTMLDHDLDSIHEAAGRSGWVKVAAIALQSKVNAVGNQIRATSDTAKKLDLMATQMKWVAGLTTLAIATDLQDKSIMKGIRK